MLATIELDDELCSGIIEICDIGSEGLLAIKTQAGEVFRAQKRLELSSALCGLKTQVACSFTFVLRSAA